jgi:lysophospholipase L1-like esterase
MTSAALRWTAVWTTVLASVFANAAEQSVPVVKLVGDWQVQVVLPAQTSGSETKEASVTLDVPPPTIITVRAEKYAQLPLFNAKAPPWAKGIPLISLEAQECATRGLLDTASLEVRAGPQPNDERFEANKDFRADLDWAAIARLPEGRIKKDQPVWLDYRHATLRIDTIVLTREGRVELRRGEPHVAAPLPPLGEGERRLANVWLPGRISKLTPDDLFPILETSYPEPPKESPSPAERFLPKTLKKLQEGRPVRILAWGDSVTDASYLPDAEYTRWQAQFVARLQEQFPKAKVELVTEAWGGRNTAVYLAEPPGSPHNYQEKVLGARPDLVVSEFVNDAYLTPEQVEDRYAKLLADFTAIGAEWIILTPHYVRPDWMGLTSQREIDADPRPYVTGLRQFAARHSMALADASLRWGRLWRQGIPYSTLFLNAINHPDARGMKLFADSLMVLFP